MNFIAITTLQDLNVLVNTNNLFSVIFNQTKHLHGGDFRLDDCSTPKTSSRFTAQVRPSISSTRILRLSSGTRHEGESHCRFDACIAFFQSCTIRLSAGMRQGYVLEWCRTGAA